MRQLVEKIIPLSPEEEDRLAKTVLEVDKLMFGSIPEAQLDRWHKVTGEILRSSLPRVMKKLEREFLP